MMRQGGPMMGGGQPMQGAAAGGINVDSLPGLDDLDFSSEPQKPALMPAQPGAPSMQMRNNMSQGGMPNQ